MFVNPHDLTLYRYDWSNKFDDLLEPSWTFSNLMMVD